MRQLESERRRKINQLTGLHSKDKRYDDDYKDGKRYKRNNGNHHGWSNGKGNPHHGK
jgi:hypothetical protein